jgi:uncharacterized protein YcaQ
MSETVYPLSVIRAVALHTQALDTQPGQEPEPTPENMYQLIQQLGCVQIDTLHMVQRSQYLVLWSRLGSYGPQDLDHLAYDPEHRKLFEYWQHAASLIPLTEYRYHMPFMRWFREGNHHWGSSWLEKPGSHELVQAVRERIQREGALRASDFEHNGGPRGTWWDWKPAKQALEHLFNTGELMITNRKNFQRVYDLHERVLPEWVDTREPTMEERDSHRLEQAIKALGFCDPVHAADYTWMKRGDAAPHIKALLEKGVLRSVKAQFMNGKDGALVIHRDNLPFLERAAAAEIVPLRTTFLSPFDSLFWARGRDVKLWDFRQTLEAYIPETKRIWGYFCLPILYKDRLVGRFDPKLERSKGLLRLRAVYLEPGIEMEEELVQSVAKATRDFMKFHQAKDVAIERSTPEEFGVKLIEVL